MGPGPDHSDEGFHLAAGYDSGQLRDFGFQF